MTMRRPHMVEAEKAADVPATQPLVLRPALTGTSGMAGRLVAPQTRAEAEEAYVSARDAWTAAMRASSSGRSVDLASLAITQEAYEAATAERERWISGERVPVRISPGTTQRGVDAAVGQELAWKRVRESDPKAPGLLGRLARKLRGS